MNIPQIEIPPDIPAEFLALLEELNEMLARATRDVEALNRNPENFPEDHRQEIVDRSKKTLHRFLELREQLRGYQLEWSEWPEIVED